MAKKTPYSDVKIRPYESLDEKTGAVNTRVLADYNPETHKVSTIRDKTKIPSKSKEPFVMINRLIMQLELTYDEKCMFYLLTELIGWENNFIQSEVDYITLSGLEKTLGKTRNFITKQLKLLEAKGMLKLVDIGNKKYIYLYSRFVWFGYDNNRSDQKLTDFLAGLCASEAKGY